jgi:hypothetical protein
VPKDTIFANDDGCKNAVSEQSSPGYRPHRPTFTWMANPPHLLGTPIVTLPILSRGWNEHSQGFKRYADQSTP